MPTQRIGFVLSLFLLAAVPVMAQNAPTKNAGGQSGIRVNVNLVNLPVSVTDSQGQFVSGLARGDFRIFEDGRPQNITLFEEADIPATVGLLVDHSGSMRPILPEVSAAATAFARSSNPKDEMFVVDFNDIVSLELPAAVPFTSDVRQLEKAVSGGSVEGRTALNDAIAVGLDQLRSAHRDRQALIIVSDGGDNASKHKFAEVLSQARASKASIYAIGIFAANEADRNPGVLEQLAKATGGKAYFPQSVNEVAAICTQIAREIRTQYTLGYSPSNTNSEAAYRKIAVKVDAPNHARLHVRTRAGYLVSQPKPTPSSAVVSAAAIGGNR
jgi:Ca-activated chloride channel family protein